MNWELTTLMTVMCIGILAGIVIVGVLTIRESRKNRADSNEITSLVLKMLNATNEILQGIDDAFKTIKKHTHKEKR